MEMTFGTDDISTSNVESTLNKESEGCAATGESYESLQAAIEEAVDKAVDEAIKEKEQSEQEKWLYIGSLPVAAGLGAVCTVCVQKKKRHKDGK